MKGDLLHLALLGKPQFKRNNQPLELTSVKGQALLAYLAVTRQPHSRSALAGLLWSDMPEADARTNLRVTLSQLRKAVGDAVIATRRTVELNVDADIWLDVAVLEEAVSSGNNLATAAGLYRGEFLDDFQVPEAELFEEWLLIERERLRQLALSVLGQLADTLLAQGDYATGIKAARQLLGIEPWYEAGHRQLMKLLAADGQRSAALAQYETCKRLLAEELGIEPTAKTEALRTAIVQGEPWSTPEEPPAVPALQSMPTVPRLFGRTVEMDKLIGLWNRSVSGHGHFAIVSGEAGLGKSHLVLSLAEQVTRQGGLVLTGHCYEFEQSLPFQAIVEMLRAATNLLQQVDLAPAYRMALAHLVPDLPGVADNPPVAAGHVTGQPRAQLFEALRQAFLALTRRQPLLLLVEDVHWAAESTLDWLAYLIPRLGTNPLLVAITYRTDEVDPDHTLPRLERYFAREGRILRLSLEPLSRQASRELVAHLTDLDEPQVIPLADRLFAETSGNAFFLHELVRSLIETGQVQVKDGQWTSTRVEAGPDAEIWLPDSLRDTIEARLARLSEMSRLFIRTAAVAGRVFDYDVVHQAGEWVAEQSLGALEDLLARGFLRTGEMEGSFTFSHHLVQEVIYAGLTPPRRVYLHRRLAEVIQTLQPPDVEALVHHFMAAGEQEQAIEYAVQAAQRADAMYAYEEAANYRRMALTLLGEQTQPAVRLSLLEGLADDYRLLRNGPQAIATYTDALDLWQILPEVDKFTGLRLYRKSLEAIADMRGNAAYRQFEAAAQTSAVLRARFEHILPHLEEEPPHPEVVYLFKALAIDALTSRFPAGGSEAIRYAQAAVAVAERLNSPVELAAALMDLARVYGAHGWRRERLEAAFRALAICREPNFDNIRESINILVGTGSALLISGDYERAIPYFLEVESLADVRQAVYEQNLALSLLIQCWFRLDRWPEMLNNLEKMRALQQEYSLERVGGTFCFAIALCGAVHALRGKGDEAEALRQEAQAIMTDISGPPEQWRRANHY